MGNSWGMMGSRRNMTQRKEFTPDGGPGGQPSHGIDKVTHGLKHKDPHEALQG